MSGTTLRRASLTDLADMLRDQQTRKVDVVTDPLNVRSRDGLIWVTGSEPVLTDNGVELADGRYEPTDVFLEGLAGKLNVPPGYLKRLHADRTDLFDANVNGWLRGSKPMRKADGTVEQVHPPDPREFLVRTLSGEGEQVGVARAFLSDRYAVFDHLDALTAALDGVRASGMAVDVAQCDLTDRRMTLKVRSEEVKALAPVLLKGYRSPFSGLSGDDNPTVFAGFLITNSETGGGAYTLTPQLIVEVCGNGMTISKDAIRAVHLGGKLEPGIIRWSQETNRAALALVKGRTRDAVATFLDVDYVVSKLAEMEKVAVKPVDGDVAATVTRVGLKLAFTQAETAGVLDHFVRGGQMTAGGVLHAVTSYSQTIENADRAAAVEESGLRAMALV